MAGWRRCDRCRRVLPGEDYEGESATCRACLTVPVRAVPKLGPVVRSRTTPRPAAAPGPRAALRGIAGSGDLEVRERRARRKAQDLLVESHPEEFALLLRDARLAEGLRPAGPGPSGEQPPDPS